MYAIRSYYDGNWLGLPNGPYQAEWDEYNSILAGSGVDAGNYYDLPGNHDEYNDGTLAYYRANSVQGRATGSTQVSWSRDYPFGSYHRITSYNVCYTKLLRVAAPLGRGEEVVELLVEAQGHAGAIGLVHGQLRLPAPTGMAARSLVLS